MLTDNQTFTIGATSHTLALVLAPSAKDPNSVRKNPDGTVLMTVGTTTTKKDRMRHAVRVDWLKVVTDPITSQNDTDSVILNFSLDRPLAGFSQADVESLVTAFKTWLTTTIAGQLYQGQS